MRPSPHHFAPLLCFAPCLLPCRYHLEIIKSLAAMCAEVFQGGAVQYAFTTIPTYPRCEAREGSARNWIICLRPRCSHAPRPSHSAANASMLAALWSANICTLHPTPPSCPAPARLCSGQIGFMICTKAGGSAPLDAREPRQPLPVTPEGRDYPPLR